jgi:hypothetical protein
MSLRLGLQKRPACLDLFFEQSNCPAFSPYSSGSGHRNATRTPSDGLFGGAYAIIFGPVARTRLVTRFAHLLYDCPRTSSFENLPPFSTA